MGYSTDFIGTLTLNKKLTKEDSKFLKDFNVTRRMKRNLNGYGVDGEFFVGNLNNCGQDDTPDVVDHNSPPSTQPGLWCQWVPTEDDMGLEWDGGEKAYNMEDWLVYLINRYLEPRGYMVNGEVEAQGEERGDNWVIKVENNLVKVSIATLIQGASCFIEVRYHKAPKLPSLVKTSHKKKSIVKVVEDIPVKLECKRDKSSGKLWISQESIITGLKSQLKLITGSKKENLHVRVILKHLIEQYENF